MTANSKPRRNKLTAKRSEVSLRDAKKGAKRAFRRALRADGRRICREAR
jgi:hypothetical protein